MKKKLEEKILQYVAVRNFANTYQRKQMIDTQCRVYLFKNVNSVADYDEALEFYKKHYKPKTI